MNEILMGKFSFFFLFQVRFRFGLYDEVVATNGRPIRYCNWIRFLRVSDTYGPQVSSIRGMIRYFGRNRWLPSILPFLPPPGQRGLHKDQGRTDLRSHPTDLCPPGIDRILFARTARRVVFRSHEEPIVPPNNGLYSWRSVERWRSMYLESFREWELLINDFFWISLQTLP